MSGWWWARVGLCALSLLLFAVAWVPASSNRVPVSGLAQRTRATTVQELAPAECAGLGLSQIVINLDNQAGANSLVLGSGGNDVMFGWDGNDCLVGGAGTDTLEGALGADVCIGTRISTFVGCETVVYRP